MSMNTCKAAINALATQTCTEKESREFVLEFFDVGSSGKMTKANLEGALLRLVNVALAHTDGKFLEVTALQLC